MLVLQKYIYKLSDNKWQFETDKNGNGSLVFYFVNDNDPKDIKYVINYEFKVFLNQMYMAMWIFFFSKKFS